MNNNILLPVLHTWSQYKEWVANEAHKGKNYWYRGQSDATWVLKTTFHRLADKNGMTMLQYLNLVETELHYQVSSRLNETINLKDEFAFGSYLALLRNHGFPSPLLDWTISPYVAAYFAFRESNNFNPICRRIRIYVFDFKLWQDTYAQPKDLKATEPYVSVVRPHAKYNPRQLAQNTVYTVTNVSDMGGHIDGNKKTQSFLYFFELSADLKNNIIKELDLMGINEMTLFPDLDGLCREINKKYFNI